MQKIDLIGQKFGRLTIIREETRNKQGRPMFVCLCECGNTKIINGDSLKNGHTKSCGCFRRETITKHGISRTPIYKIWGTK